MKLRKRALALLAIVVMLCAIGASQAAQEATGEENSEILLYHHMAEMTDYLTNWCAEITQKYPNIKIEQETQRDTATLQVKYAAGDDPDIVLGPQTQQYYDQGKFLNLTPFTHLTDRLDPDMFPVITDVKTGNVYRIPMAMNTFGVFYNTQIFDELGLTPATNWDEFIANATTIRDAKPDIIPVYFQSGNYGHQVQYLALGLRMLDIGVLEMQTAAALNDTETLNFVGSGYLDLYANTILNMQKEKLFDSEIAITGNAASANEAFATGATAMLFNGTWWYGSVRNQFPQVNDFLGFSPIPAIDNRGLYSSKGQDSALSFSAVSKYPESLQIVMNELYDPAQLKAWSEKRGAPSSFNDVESNWGHPDVVAAVQDIFQNMNCSGNQTFLPTGFGLDIIEKTVAEVLVGTLTPEEFVQKFQDQWNSCF